MELIGVLVIAALVFLVCFGVDKGFVRLFRAQAEHATGLAVRLSKKYGAFGLILLVLGIAAILAGLGTGWLMPTAGGFVALVGVGLIAYYMTFGVFYNDTGFLLTTLGRKTVRYRYADIAAQQLYNSYGNILIELYMTDGRSVQLQAGMTGVYPFLDKAFSGWCAQRGIAPECCDFHKPENSCWFPAKEEQ